MKSSEVRKKYLEFFEKRGHAVIPSASIVPENDPTTLFTGSGMQPLLPYLLGEKHPHGTRLVNSQKSFRAEDIEEVGDNRHTTFFEMLGNWSLGDYWKEEQLKWFLEFLTEEIGIQKERLWATCFEGDKKLNLPPDNESVEIWKKLGIPEEKIRFYDAGKNWWSRAGAPENMPAGEPGGPDSEVFYEFTDVKHDKSFGEECHPNCDCGRFMEIGNSVFMEYIKQEDGSFKELEQKNVDFGGGLERITAAANNDSDIFKIDSFKAIIEKIEALSKKSYKDAQNQISFRIVADHLRGAVFMIGDGVLPSNTEQGYFVRRLLRRAVRHMDALGVEINTLHTLVSHVIEHYKDAYPSLSENKTTIESKIRQEEDKFRKTLTNGLKEFEKIWERRKYQFGDHTSFSLTDEDLFNLYQSYGFPVELSIEEINKYRKRDDRDALSEEMVKSKINEFQKKMKRHQETSRKGAEQKFKGGLADTGVMSTKYHTATHLLQQALRDVLGEHVSQKGSNITGERLRFDFSHDKKMTDEEKKEVEEIVNKKIADALPVSYTDLSFKEAEKLGAIGLFEEKYGDTVRVYSIGDYSLEYCGGPHVKNTKELGVFKIKKEEAVQSGVRRIKAVLE